NTLQDDPPPDPPPPCPMNAMGGDDGTAFFVDTRKPTDPVTLATLPVLGEPFGGTIAGGRAYIVSGRHVGTKNGPKCTPFPAQIPDLYAQSHGVRPPSQ